MRWLLMNKDTPVMSFISSTDEYGEVVLSEEDWLSDRKPLGYISITSFVERRKAPKHRKHIEELLIRYGCDDLEGFLNVAHALSLNDTLWVKEENSPLMWADVSLYHNTFNEMIAQAAFDGEWSGSEMSTTSPEFGTDGSYAKCWVREDDRIMLYKCGSDEIEIEPVSEFLASQIAETICPNHVAYDLAFYHHRLISKCELFTSEEIGLAKVYDLGLQEKTIASLLKFFDSIGSGDDFRRMCVLDALIMNTDRHLGNFGVLFDNDTMEIRGMAPVFDNNRSLFFHLDSDQLRKVDWYAGKCKPRIGTDFMLTAKGLMTDDIRQDLRNLSGFRFAQHETISIEQERLDLLSDFVDRQIQTLLS